MRRPLVRCPFAAPRAARRSHTRRSRPRPAPPADEIIRQVAVNCSERGVVLLRVRDEIRLTLASLQGLYESSVAFGMRKALMAEQRKAELKARIRILNAEVAELDRAADGLRARLAEMDAADAARAAADDAKHAAETAKLRANNEALKEALDAALGKS